jgi:hypothetical protein
VLKSNSAQRIIEVSEVLYEMSKMRFCKF